MKIVHPQICTGDSIVVLVRRWYISPDGRKYTRNVSSVFRIYDVLYKIATSEFTGFSGRRRLDVRRWTRSKYRDANAHLWINSGSRVFFFFPPRKPIVSPSRYHLYYLLFCRFFFFLFTRYRTRTLSNTSGGRVSVRTYTVAIRARIHVLRVNRIIILG